MKSRAKRFGIYKVCKVLWALGLVLGARSTYIDEPSVRSAEFPVGSIELRVRKAEDRVRSVGLPVRSVELCVRNIESPVRKVEDRVRNVESPVRKTNMPRITLRSGGLPERYFHRDFRIFVRSSPLHHG